MAMAWAFSTNGWNVHLGSCGCEMRVVFGGVEGWLMGVGGGCALRACVGSRRAEKSVGDKI